MSIFACLVLSVSVCGQSIKKEPAQTAGDKIVADKELLPEGVIKAFAVFKPLVDTGKTKKFGRAVPIDKAPTVTQSEKKYGKADKVVVAPAGSEVSGGLELAQETTIHCYGRLKLYAVKEGPESKVAWVEIEAPEGKDDVSK
jgi:hypothetical protein